MRPHISSEHLISERQTPILNRRHGEVPRPSPVHLHRVTQGSEEIAGELHTGLDLTSVMTILSPLELHCSCRERIQSGAGAETAT